MTTGTEFLQRERRKDQRVSVSLHPNSILAFTLMQVWPATVAWVGTAKETETKQNKIKIFSVLPANARWEAYML